MNVYVDAGELRRFLDYGAQKKRNDEMKHIAGISRTPAPLCAQEDPMSNEQLLALIAILLSPLALIFRLATLFKW